MDKEEKICIGIPVAGSVCPEVLTNLLAQAVCCGRRGRVTISIADNLFPYDRARECILGQALEEDCNLLYFVDADIKPPPKAFEQLYRTLRDNKAQAVSGWYVRRGRPFTCVWSVKLDHPGTGRKMVCTVDARAGVHKIYSSGLGCALIDLAWCRENMERPYFWLESSRETGTIVWEDWSFFELLNERGGLALGDANVRCQHRVRDIFVDDKNDQVLRSLDFQEEHPEIAQGGEMVEVK